MKKYNSKNNKKGSVLIFTMMTIAILLFIAMGIANLSLSERQASISVGRSGESLQLAEGVIENTLFMVKNFKDTGGNTSIKKVHDFFVESNLYTCEEPGTWRPKDLTDNSRFLQLFSDCNIDSSDPILCSDVDSSLASVKVIKSIGRYRENSRALAVNVDFSMVSVATCGNNILEFGEQCDDGNTVSGDGCSASCQNE